MISFVNQNGGIIFVESNKNPTKNLLFTGIYEGEDISDITIPWWVYKRVTQHKKK